MRMFLPNLAVLLSISCVVEVEQICKHLFHVYIERICMHYLLLLMLFDDIHTKDTLTKNITDALAMSRVVI